MQVNQHRAATDVAPPAHGGLSIACVSAESAGPWDSFVDAQPTGSFYHLYGWRKLNEETLGHTCEYLAARDAAGHICGVLPLVFVRSRVFGRILCSLPFVNYGGPCAADPAVATALARHAAARADSLGADYLEMRCATALDVDMPVSLKKVSMTVRLDADPDVLWNAFTTKHRKNVKRAQKNELPVEVGGIELLDDFYAVLEKSWRRLGTPLYRADYFRRVLEAFPQNSYVYVCRHRGQPAAAALVGHFKGIVEGMWLGINPALAHLQPNYVLYWEMLRHTCLQGHARFHLGRSTAESGAEQFKSRWNAETEQLHWYFHRRDGGAMPALNVDNPKYRLAIAVWQRLPLWMTRLAGPPLARLIP
jgi:FemAB-related protein (PEP-CTERM system-associated)